MFNFRKRKPTQEQVDRQAERISSLTNYNLDLCRQVLVYQNEIRKLNKACVRNKRKYTNLRNKADLMKAPSEAGHLVGNILNEFRPGWQFEAILAQKSYPQAVFDEVRKLAANSRFNVVIRENIQQGEDGHLYHRASRLHQTTDAENLAFLQAAQDAGYPIQEWDDVLDEWFPITGKSDLAGPVHYYRVDPDYVPEPVTTAEVPAEMVSDPPPSFNSVPLPSRPLSTGEVAAAINGVVIGAAVGAGFDELGKPDETLPWEGHGGSSGGAGASASFTDPETGLKPGWAREELGPPRDPYEAGLPDFKDVQSSVSSTEDSSDK